MNGCRRTGWGPLHRSFSLLRCRSNKETVSATSLRAQSQEAGHPHHQAYWYLRKELTLQDTGAALWESAPFPQIMSNIFCRKIEKDLTQCHRLWVKKLWTPSVQPREHVRGLTMTQSYRMVTSISFRSWLRCGCSTTYGGSPPSCFYFPLKREGAVWA